MRKRLQTPRLTASRRRRPILVAGRGQETSRGGTTLTEVLMAILCMGIGVVAVAALFPIALLRSVQATQLTSATILRFNAETLIDIDSDIIFDPDLQDADMDTPPNNYDEHFNQNYLVDPLGWNIFNTNTVGKMSRYNYGLTNVGQAANFVTLPDSWVDWYDAQPEMPLAVDSTDPDWQSVNVPAGLISQTELQEVQQSLPPADGTAAPALYQRNNTPRTASDAPVRVVLFDSNGRLSEVRELVNQQFIDPANGQIRWPASNPLPANNYGTVSRVRLQFQERRYTWLLTVRNDTPVTTVDPAAAHARVDVVVFFRRSFEPADEIPYRLTGNGRTYVVSKINNNDPNPFLKKGGFMLNTDTGTWHRMQKVDENTQTITLERNTQTLNDTTAVFMRGVVEVYPLGTKP